MVDMRGLDPAGRVLWLVGCPHELTTCGVWSMGQDQQVPILRASFAAEWSSNEGVLVLRKSVFFLLDGSLWSYRIGGQTVVRLGPADYGPIAFLGHAIYGAHDSNGGALRLYLVADGSTQAVRLTPADAGGVVGSPVVDGSTAFFLMSDDLNGLEVWSTDGTPSGTRRETSFAAPNPFGYAYFSSDWIRAVGRRAVFGIPGGLWVTTGAQTAEPLLRVCADCSVDSLVRVPNGLVVRAVASGAKGGIWTTDGTVQGTKKLAGCPGGCDLFESPSGAFFRVGSAIWRTDGTVYGTIPWLTGLPPTEQRRVLRGDLLYYLSTPKDGSRTLIRVDLKKRSLTANAQVLLARVGIDPSCVRDFGDRVAYVDGTNQLNTVPKIGGGGNVIDEDGSCPVAAVGKLFYEGLFNLMMLDGGSGVPHQVPGSEGFDPTDVFGGQSILAWKNGIVFGGNYRNLYSSDGSASGTILREQYPDDSEALHFAASEGAIYVSADGFASSLGLWRSTLSGTPTQISGPPDSSYATFDLSHGAARLGASLFVPIRNADVGVLRYVDGDLTPHPLDRSFSEYPGPELLPLPHVVVGFGASSYTGELFSITEDGHSISLGLTAPNDGESAVVFGSKVCFASALGGSSQGAEPWCTNGTPEGTRLLKDIYPGPTSSAAAHFVVAGKRMFFSARDPDHGAELWVTDGTSAGTRLYLDLRPGAVSSGATPLAVIGGYLYFAGDNGLTGRQLWRIAIGN
jgi:ELWxxDGT repeat protein